MIDLKGPAEIATMREAGRVVANALRATRDYARAGVSLRELDDLAASVISDAGAKPSFLHYNPSWADLPYPGVICTSVNDAVVHGIPGSYLLAEGDLLSIDCGAYIDGLHGDAALSLVVGQPDPVDLALIEDTERALHAGITAAKPGARLGDIGHAIGAIGRSRGYGLLQHHGGHGIGRAMHEDPFVHNEGRPRKGMVLRPGLTIAIEPMFIVGGHDGYWQDPNGWTVRTADGSRAAHVEHTIVVTEDGPVILTAP